MKILNYALEEYTSLEQELCEIHSGKEEELDKEYEIVCNRFREAFSNFEDEKDYELPEWHHNIRMLWVYIYNEKLYTKTFIETIQKIIDMPNSWFAQFECYSEELKCQENRSGAVGDFYLYKDTLVFDLSEPWPNYKEKLGITNGST